MHADNHESLLQIDSMVLMGIDKHSQSSQNSKLASKFPTRFMLSLLLGMTNLYNIWKKEVRNGGYFWHADKRLKFLIKKLVLSFLMEVAKHNRNTQNRKLVIFLQYIKKNCCNCPMFYCNAKHSDILRGSSHVRCYLFTVLMVLEYEISCKLFCKFYVSGKFQLSIKRQI